MITEWEANDGKIEIRDTSSDLGGTMRLGSQQTVLTEGSLVAEIYNSDGVFERHRHRYEVNELYLEPLKKNGLVVSGRSKDNNLVEIIELNNHPWFIGCQFHPEFTSSPRIANPLFISFIKAAVTYKDKSS